MLRCNEVTRLVSSDEIRETSLRKRLGVRLHLMMCRSCRRYVRELAAIAEALRTRSRETREDPERIDAMVRRALGGDERGSAGGRPGETGKRQG